MPDKNEEYILATFEKLGFGNYFNEAFLKGKEAKLPAIPFEPGEMVIGKATLEILPKVVEEKKLGEGFYVMKGYQATRTKEGKPEVSQFINVFKNIGHDVNQAERLLDGGAVRYVSEWVDRKPIYSYAQLNFQDTTTNGNFKVMKRADDNTLMKTLRPLRIYGGQEEKEDIFIRLQKGDRVQVTIQDGNDAKRVQIQVAVRKSGIGVDLLDLNGALLKQFPEVVENKLQSLKAPTTGVRVPDGTIHAVTSTKEDNPLQQGGNKIS